MDKFIILNDNKRYYTQNRYLREIFGEKVIKLSLNAGFTCPNRDGTSSTGGCIYCSPMLSGDFSGNVEKPITAQMEQQISLLSDKWKSSVYIAYFQAGSNTYAPVDKLTAIFGEALSFSGTKGLTIATRADCINDEVMELLKSLAKRTFLTVELGLQTASDKTAKIINRGFDTACFYDAAERLRNIGCDTAAHVIFGLPGEDIGDMMESVKAASVCTGVKFTCLYIPRGTVIAKMWEAGEVEVPGMEEYFDIVEKALEIVPPGCAVFRVTGDCPKKLLLAPEWTANKRQVVNYINRRFRA